MIVNNLLDHIRDPVNKSEPACILGTEVLKINLLFHLQIKMKYFVGKIVLSLDNR